MVVMVVVSYEAMPLRQDDQLKTLARRGAEVRLKELREEIALIGKMFPDLSAASRSRPQASDGKAQSVSAPAKPGRRKWTAAQRKAQATKMKAYWAKRKRA